MRKYLTEDKFDEWKDNAFAHVVKKVARMEGILWILVPLSIAILAAIVHVLRNGG